MGWNFGQLSSFEIVDLTGNVTRPRFVQIYGNGDCGSPCPSCRSATVNIHCGESTDTCTKAGQPGDVCLGGTSISGGFCLCSIKFNASMCNGLVFTLLSRKCPSFSTTPIGPNPSPPPEPTNVAAVVIATLVGIFIACYVGGYIYNYKVHAKRGAEALPFYDTCTGASSKTTYTSIAH